MSFSATAFVGFQSVPDVVVVVVVVDVDAVLVAPLFFDEPFPLAVVVVDFGPFAFEPPAWSVFTEVDFGDGPFALEEPFVVVVVEGAFVVVLVVFGPLELDVFGAASTLTVSPAAASNAAGSAIHLVIAPPAETVEQGTYPVPFWDWWA
jgi:hypothetical protein